jgi:BirA family biotin operon repressor/biotin-[acetyl-CoA-carboxylase] ligase
LLQASLLNPIGTPFIELQSVDSTNNYARQLIHADSLPDRQFFAQHGMVVFAHEQTGGRGQRGKVWASEKGQNIAMSIVIHPAFLSLNNQFQLSACTAVAVHQFFEKYAIDKTFIKWPNDLYWQDRKAGGILIESVIGRRNSGVSSWDWAIVGIGININQTRFPAWLPNPVSLKQITGSDYKVTVLAKELCEIFQNRYNELIQSGFENIFNTYNRYLYKKGEIIKLKKDNRLFEARIKGVSTDGKLISEHSMTEEFAFGDVEWVF